MRPNYPLPSTQSDYSASRSLGKSRGEKLADLHPPKKPKPGAPQTRLSLQGQAELPANERQQLGPQPALDPKWVKAHRLYVKTVARADFAKFPKRVKECPDELKPQLAKRLTDDLVAVLAAEEQSPPVTGAVVLEKSPVTEAVTRVVIALDNGLPLSQVIACLTAAEPSPELRTLSLLLRYCIVRDIEAGKPFDLLLWAQCIGKAASARDWMNQLGWLLAVQFKSDNRLLPCLLSAMTPLVAQVRHHPEEASLVSELLEGLDRLEKAGNLNLGDGADQLPFGRVRVKCDRLRAQLTCAAERLVANLDTAVQKASALANEDIAQPAGAEQRKRRIREHSQVEQLCSRIANGLGGGVLTLKEVIDALEQLPPGSETVAALMHALVTDAKKSDVALYEIFRAVLNEATRPDELVPHMAPALLEGGDGIGLAVGLVAHLADDAAGQFTRLLPVVGLVEALCLLVEDSRTLPPLSDRVRGMLREAAARQVVEAGRRVEVATDNLSEILSLERTARLTTVQLEQLGGELLEGTIEAIVRPLGSRMASAYVLEALRSFIGSPACDYLVSLLVRALLTRGSAMDVFMGALLNAEVSPGVSKMHIALARQVARGFADWGLGPEDRIGVWIDTVVPKSDAIGFEVLQVVLDDLLSLNKWGDDFQSTLVKRQGELDKRIRAAKSEPLINRYVAPVIGKIAEIRKRMSLVAECSLAEHKAEFQKNEEIDSAVNDIVRAVRRSDITMHAVIEGLFLGQETRFDWQLLLLKFIGPLFQESTVSSPYDLHNFMSSLFDVDGTSDFFSNVGVVFWAREESAADRDRLIRSIKTLRRQYQGDKLSRLQLFATEYHEGSNSEDERSQALDKVLDKINAKLEGKKAPSGTAGISVVPQPTIAVEQRISLSSTAGMRPGSFSQSIIPLHPVPEASLPDRGRPAAVRGAATNASLRPELPVPEIILPQQGPGGLPIEYSVEAPLGSDPSHLVRVDDVSLKNEANVQAKAVAEALNDGRFEVAKRLITRSVSSGVLNLAAPGVPMIQRQGLETLGKVISDPSIPLRELALGNVMRGITNVTNALKESKHLEKLDLYFFEGYDPDAPDKRYGINVIFDQMKIFYASRSMSLRHLVVSDRTVVAHKAGPELEALEKTAGSSLKVETKN